MKKWLKENWLKLVISILVIAVMVIVPYFDINIKNIGEEVGIDLGIETSMIGLLAMIWNKELSKIKDLFKK